MFYILCQVRVHVKIIRYRIGAPGYAFDNAGGIGGQPVMRCLRGVPQYTGQPQVRHPHAGNLLQRCVINSIE